MSPQIECCKCPKCNKNVTKTQKSIGCAYCANFFHLSCANFSTELYNICLKNKVLKYICDTCARMPKYCNVQEELRNGFAALTSSLEKDLENKFLENKRLLEEQLDSGLKALEAKFEEFCKKFSGDNDDKTDFQSDLKNCYNMIKIIDEVNTEKFKKLQKQNDIFQRRLNRSDIIIKGLPKKIKNLRKLVVQIAQLCNVRIYFSDIQHCTYFERGNSVLVKFNSVQIRDAIMINHRKNRNNILLKDVVGGNFTSNIFLNDHLTPEAKELMATCKKLKEHGIIKKFSYKNFDIPKVEAVFTNGSVKILNLEECVSILDENMDSSTVL